MMRTIWLLGLAAIGAFAQPPGPPAFTADRILPSGGDRTVPLMGGMLVSIYGSRLGPEQSCIGQADPRQREAPLPDRPTRNFVQTLLYPKQLCDVQVFVDDRPAGLLYVHDRQINLKVPLETPEEGTALVKVVYQGRSHSVTVPLGMEQVTLALDGIAQVGGPVWIRVTLPWGWGAVQYPVGIHPADFGCHEFEVRRGGSLLPRIALRPTGGVRSGPVCGNIGIPGHPMPHPGRFPLHLQYRFETPGAYEVRYTRKRADFGAGSGELLLQSAWTRIDVLHGAPAAQRLLPEDPAEVLSDFLPGVLGRPDGTSREIVVHYLYHPNETVRQYAALGLSYWPETEVDQLLFDLIRRRGPSDVIVDRTASQRPELIDGMLPYLRSEDPALLRGAINGVSRLLMHQRERLPAGSAVRAEQALLAAAGHVIERADPQTVVNFAGALAAVRDERGRAALWDLVERRIALGQSVIALTWRKDPRDLPILGRLLESKGEGDPLSAELSSLPYALRNAYREAALPFLESALTRSPQQWVRTNCARELILAGRPSGFAFVMAAMEGKRSYQQEMVQFLRDQFPELRGADDAAILEFLRKRAE